MKISKILHIGSITGGLIGLIVFVGTLIGDSDNLVFGITKIDALLCAGILVLIAICLQIATIHHILLEKKGEVI